MTPRVVIVCPKTPSGRHRWKWVRGIYATTEHEYVERRCKRCGTYEGDVR